MLIRVRYISSVCVSYDWKTAHKAEFHVDKNAQSQCQAQVLREP